MKVSIYFMKPDYARELSFVPSEMEPEYASKHLNEVFETQYELVAEYVHRHDDDDVLDVLAAAHVRVQNGPRSPSWGRIPPEGLVPIKGVIIGEDGLDYGNRCCQVGDILVLEDGTKYAVSLGYAFLKL